ncbi:MAG: NAD(P)/FAD-dependent oxidoreductase, partial [Methylobacterium sp.]
TSLKVSGLPVFSAGQIEAPEGAETVLMSDPGLGLYRKLVVAEDRLLGAVFVGDIAEQGWCKELIRTGASIAEHRDDLLFGRPAPASQPLAA